MSDNSRAQGQNARADQCTADNPNVDASRRRLTKAAIAAPAIVTLASRSAWGVGCLSNRLSGNLSEPDRGECVLGLSPGAWKTPGGAGDWGATPYDYANLPCSQPNGQPCNDCRDYIGGSTFAEAFPGSMDTRPMREILCNDNGTEQWHIIAALLNAYAIPNYVMTPDQVRALWQETIPVPDGMSLNSFLDSTWI